METEILTTKSSLLRKKAAKIHVITDEIKALIKKMIDVALEWEKNHPHEVSAAMAAPQIGELERIIIIRNSTDDKNDKEFTALINPEVIKTEGKTITDFEGCLSVPNIYGKVPRPEKARFKALLENGNEVRIRPDPELTRILLHEIDHLNGVLFIDHIKDNKNAFFKLDKNGNLEPLDYEKEIKNNTDLFPEED